MEPPVNAHSAAPMRKPSHHTSSNHTAAIRGAGVHSAAGRPIGLHFDGSGAVSAGPFLYPTRMLLFSHIVDERHNTITAPSSIMSSFPATLSAVAVVPVRIR